MKNEFIPYEEALALKELGFDEMYFGQYFVFEGESEPILCYDEDQYHIVKDNPNVKIETILSPTYSQAFRWFREKYKLISYINEYNKDGGLWIKIKESRNIEVLYSELTSFDINEYEEAELACLRKLIELLKPKQR